MKLGDRIRKARAERGLSLSALARLAGLSKGFLSQVEAGLSSPSLLSLSRIAASLEMPVSRLMESGELDREETGRLGPSVIRARRIARPTSAIEPSIDLGAAKSYLLTISRGQRIQGTTNRSEGGAAGCLVVSGGLSVELDGREHELEPGALITFGEASGYTLRCSTTVATLLLILPPSCEMPSAEMTVARLGATPPPPIAGPFRLVEMRAARRAARRLVP